jgi:hypothetical protein
MKIIGSESKKPTDNIRNKIEEENLTHKSYIGEQFRIFKSDDSYFKNYKGVTPGRNEVLVRMFKYSPPSQYRPSESLIVPNFETQIAGASRNKVQKYFMDDIVLPFGKVIVAGEVDDEATFKLSEGDMVSFFTNRVSGFIQNPEYVHWLQAQDVAMATPKGDPPKPLIPAVQQNYQHFQFSKFGNLYADDEDLVTFLLPIYEVRPFNG